MKLLKYFKETVKDIYENRWNKIKKTEKCIFKLTTEVENIKFFSGVQIYDFSNEVLNILYVTYCNVIYQGRFMYGLCIYSFPCTEVNGKQYMFLLIL